MSKTQISNVGKETEMRIEIVNDNGEVTLKVEKTDWGSSGMTNVVELANRIEKVRYGMPEPERVIEKTVFPTPVERFSDFGKPFDSNWEITRQAVTAVARDKENVHSSPKIAAIKLLRHLTGCGLREAKDQVEVWM